MNLEGYEVYYTKLKMRATNFMMHFAVTLAWADLIHRRTMPDGEKPIETLPEWDSTQIQRDYYESMEGDYA